MAKWLSLPSEPLFPQVDQQHFINDRRKRVCSACSVEFSATPTSPTCPSCGDNGKRVYDRLAIISGRQWGKSRIGSIAGLEEAAFPGTIGWACAPSNPMLHRYVIPAFQRIIPPEWVEDYNAEYKDLRLKNGSLIHFQTLDDPDAARGQTLDWLWIDEVCLLTELHWDTLRPSLAGDQVAFFTTSPRGYDWVYKNFYLKALAGVPGYWACTTKSSDSANPRMSKEFLLREKENMSDLRFRQEYEADFVTFEGAVYGDLIHPQIIHDVTSDGDKKLRELIPEWPDIAPWRVGWMGIDEGADHPTGAVKLISANDHLIVVDEYLERDRPFAEHSAAFKRISHPHDIKYAINKNARQPMMEFARHGIMAIPSDNDQWTGIERVRTWLHTNRLWFVESRVPRTIEQLQSLHWLEEKKDQQHRDTPQVFKMNDELPDALRYALMAFPILPKEPEDPIDDPISHYPQKIQDEINFVRRFDARAQEDEAKLSGDDEVFFA